jgi:hypothetical protein
MQKQKHMKRKPLEIKYLLVFITFTSSTIVTNTSHVTITLVVIIGFQCIAQMICPLGVNERYSTPSMSKFKGSFTQHKGIASISMPTRAL